MTRDELDDGLLRWGGDFARWPKDAAEAAQRLVAADPVAARMVMELRATEEEMAAAVRPPPFGAAEIGRVLSAIADSDGTWRPGRRFLIAGASVSALSFAAGAWAMFAAVSSYGLPELSLALAALGGGQGDIGGLL